MKLTEVLLCHCPARILGIHRNLALRVIQGKAFLSSLDSRSRGNEDKEQEMSLCPQDKTKREYVMSGGLEVILAVLLGGAALGLLAWKVGKNCTP